MASHFSCGNGHRWEADDNGAGSQECPTCGSAGAVRVAASPEPPETIDLPPSAIPTPDPQEATWIRPGVEPVVFDSDPDIALPRGKAEPPTLDRSKLDALAAAAAAHRPVLPDYDLLEELGRGGMGVVYKARHLRLKRFVALKMILSGPHAGTDELERFVTEAEAAARLQHANIVQIYEIGEHEGRPYFSLEYVEGGSLEHRIDGKPLPPRSAARLVELLARAMQYAHARGIVHRDLKPANVLLAHDREARAGAKPKGKGSWLDEVVPKITDFGLAKKLDGDGGQTRTGSILGTPNYMAPEQATGQVHAVGPRSDIYALGAILYELLTGRPPFHGESAYDTLRRVASAEPLPPRSLVAGLPRDVETICLKCLNKDPRRRYADALEMARDLRRFQDGETIRARPTPAWERAAKWTRRRPGTAALLAAGVVLLVAAVVGGLARHAQLQAEAEREANRRAELEHALNLSRQRLVRLTVANGAGLLDDGDLIGSLPWLAEAMRLEGDDPAREAVHRLRLGAVLEQCPRLAQVWFHADRINGVTFSPDGGLLVSASEDGTAQIWDVTTGLAAPQTPRHDKAVLRAAFSFDGTLLATAGADGTARIWKSDSGMSVSDPAKHPKEVVAVAFDPEGKRLLTACKDGTARLWKVPELEPLPVVARHAAPLTQAVFSPDGSRLLTAAEDGTAQVWNAENGLPLARPPRQRGAIHDVAFRPDGRLFVTACADGSARAWRTDSGLPATPALRHAGAVLHAVFSADGRLIATAGADQTARVWNATNGQPMGIPFRHGSKVFTAVFGPSARRLLTTSDDNTARVWDATTGAPLGPPLKHNGSVACGTFSPDGHWVVTGGNDGMVRLWSTTAARRHVPPLRHEGRVTSAVFSRSGGLLATASDDQAARIWDADSGEPVTPPLHHPGAVNRVTFSANDRLLLTAGQDGAARTWNAQTGELVGKPLVHGQPLADAAFRPDGTRIVTAGADGTARIWDVATGTSPVPPLHHDGPVIEAAFSPDGRQVVTASADGTAGLWDAESGARLHQFKHAGGVNAAVFSGDGRRVATAGADHLARVWDAATGKPVAPPVRHGSPILGVAFSPDGHRIVTAGDDNTARVWSVDNGEPITPPLRHMGSVSRVVFSTDAGGQLVATASHDGTARIWDAATGEPITPPLKHRGPVADVVFGPRGTHVVTCGPFAARLWRLTPDERPVDDLVQAARVLAVGRIDETGGLVALDTNAVRAAWDGMRGKHPDLADTPQTDSDSWHRRELEECATNGDWRAAVWHLDRLLAARPRDPHLLRLRGDAHAGTGDWQRALGDYTQAIEQAPNDWDARLRRGLAYAQLRQWLHAAADFAKNRDVGTDEPRVWQYYALASLAGGDTAAYRATCADLLARFGRAADVETAQQVVWTALLLPKALDDPERLVTEAERVAKARPKSAFARLTLGGALLRAGRVAEAIEKLESALPDSRNRSTDVYLFLTLACQQAGKDDDARRWFDRAAEALDESAKETEDPSAWDRRLEQEILRSEAERVFKQGKP
jgi:WD40 repeat protein/serine/threonine protein kinase/tetratricopeptide (TPR) repeat protein